MLDNSNRRRFLAALTAMPTLLASAAMCAETYPSRPIRLIVSALPGQSADIVMRVMAEKMSIALGQQVIVDNRPGAGQAVGLAAGARATADGYTLSMAPSAMTVSPSVSRNLPYDPVKDFAPISNISSVTLVFATSPESPLRSLADLINAAKANPESVTFGSTLNGTPHLTVELFAQRAGIRLRHVPYKGSTQAHIDVIGRQIQFLSDSLPALVPHLKSGKMKALALSSRNRQPFLPDVPTIAESGLPDFEVSGWIGLMAPAGTPANILDRINAEVVKILADETVRARLYQLTTTPVGNSRAEFADFIVKELAKWREVVQRAGIKIE